MYPQEKVRTFTDLAHRKYDGYAFVAGYFGSMVASMIDEMRMRGYKEMANYYELQIANSIITLQEK